MEIIGLTEIPIPVVDVLSEGLGDLGYTFVMSSLLSTDAK